jgi:phosphoribosylamine--glycine ligase
MKLLLVDPQGASLDIAMRAHRDGHDVRMVIRDTPKTVNIGKGIVPVVDGTDLARHLRWADLVVLADNTRWLQDVDAYRAAGGLVVGPSKEAADWELDREVGQQIMKNVGIEVPPYRIFSDYDSAIAFVKKEDRRFVSKPSGDADKALSYVSKTPADMVYMLERWKKFGKLKGDFILQDFKAGIEMAVGGWWGPGGFNEGWCENFEFKKLMNSDLGVATGEQGTVLRFVRSSKLARRLLTPLQEDLERIGYTGYIDVNTIIDETGNIWPLEFTMRPGWPTFNIQQALNEGDTVEWLMELAQGRDARNFSLDRLAIGVVLSIPDYPYSHITRKEVTGIPIYGIKPGMWQHLHPCEMMLEVAANDVDGRIVNMPMPCTAGDYVLVMTATADTIGQAKETVYRRLKRLVVPNSPMYRTDIGDRLSKQLPLLQKMGFASGMTF